MSETTYKKKLIEVALPLDEINAACKADKDRKTGTIRNLHKWFAPMPLPAWRALLFAALVDDPEDENLRVYLLDLIKRLVANGADVPDGEVLSEAQDVLAKQFPQGLPPVLDPFCGGGSTLIEAARLGLPAFGSDLNPVAVLITRTLVELLPAVRGRRALHGSAERGGGLFAVDDDSTGFQGLETDLMHYAELVRVRAENRLRQHFPPPQDGVPVAWLWARTIPCPNPACGIETVLATNWWLAKRKGALAWIEPERSEQGIRLRVRSNQSKGEPPSAPKIGRGGAFSCLGCGQPISEGDLKALALDGKLGLRMTAVVLDTSSGRLYREPTEGEVAAAKIPEELVDIPDLPLGDANQYLAPPRFGFGTFLSLFAPRQAATLAVLADEVAEIRTDLEADGASPEWAGAITTLLGLAVGKRAQYGSTMSAWKLDSRSGTGKAERAFARADIPMTWDFAEASPFGDGAGSWIQCVRTLTDALGLVPTTQGSTRLSDARRASLPTPGLVATDPPYFDAIAYADLSDFFYMWHRRALRGIHSDLYSTIAAPKAGELTAFAWHHGGTREGARDYFIDGFTETFRNLQAGLDEDLPMLVVYASKEQKGGKEEETRWSSILTSMINADLEITGTWPIHGTGSTRMRGIGANAVATYIVMVCRPRGSAAGTISLGDFNRALRRELAPKVRDLQAASILPVDLAQAAMGPGMSIYSRYRAVVDQSGERVRVEQALRLINAALSEVLDEQEGDLDSASRFATRWWESYGWGAADFGDADKAARPLGISVDDVKRAQVASSVGNKIQLLGNQGLDRSWTPATDRVPTAWEAVHHLVDRLVDGGGELEAARLMGALGQLQDPAMELAYRLHDIAAKKGRAADQERYNALISSWAELVRLSGDGKVSAEGLF